MPPWAEAVATSFLLVAIDTFSLALCKPNTSKHKTSDGAWHPFRSIFFFSFGAGCPAPGYEAGAAKAGSRLFQDLFQDVRRWRKPRAPLQISPSDGKGNGITEEKWKDIK